MYLLENTERVGLGRVFVMRAAAASATKTRKRMISIKVPAKQKPDLQTFFVLATPTMKQRIVIIRSLRSTLVISP